MWASFGHGVGCQTPSAVALVQLCQRERCERYSARVGKGKVPASKRECAFCSNRPDSREHVFGDWMTPVLGIDRKEVQTIYSHSYTVDPGHVAMGIESVFRSRIRRRSGNPAGRREQMVCRACNSGWMSQVETKVIPVLTPLIYGQATDLSPDDQAILALWADKTAIVWEYADDKPVVSTKAHRRGMKAELAAMPNSRVWIGKYDNPDEIKAPKIVDIVQFLPPKGLYLDRRSILREELRNARFTILAMGKVCFYVQYGTTSDALTSYPPLMDTSIWRRFDMIHPSSGSTLSWPMARGLSYADIMDQTAQQDRNTRQ